MSTLPTRIEREAGRRLGAGEIVNITAARERALSRTLMLYISTGVVFMLLPGAIAIVAAEYPQIRKVLLLAPSVDAGKTAIEEAFGKFRGEVYIAIGEDDESVGKEGGNYFLGLATSARKKKLVIIPNCDHQFQGRINGKIMGKAPFWAFAADESFPSAEDGMALYD